METGFHGIDIRYRICKFHAGFGFSLDISGLRYRNIRGTL
jgi:hypothetical protein